MGQLVAIVGRPNVGKSTLFNRLTQTRTAIVDPTAGTTRDRQYGKVDWNGKEFSIVDTGGWVVNSEDVFESEINKQVELAIEQADEILFVVDAMNGVTDLDDHVAEILRKSRKPVILVANKVDSNEWVYNVPEFYSLGLGDPYPVSAVNGYGTGDLLDEVVKKLPEKEDDAAELEDIPKFAIVGRPNAGKSSLINAFIGEDRHIVTDIAGTTRDSIYTRYSKFGFDRKISKISSFFIILYAPCTQAHESAILFRSVSSVTPSSRNVVGSPISLIKSANASTPACAISVSDFPVDEILQTSSANRTNFATPLSHIWR